MNAIATFADLGRVTWEWIGNAMRTTRQDPNRTRIAYVPMRHAGVHVDHDTAMKYSAVFRAIAYISQTIAGLPWDVIRETPDRTQKMPLHPIWRLLRTRPNPEMSGGTFRETLMAWALSWGNGIAEIESDEAGRPVNLWPISPDRVTIKRELDTKRIYYEIQNYGKAPTILFQEEVFHIHGLGFDGISGYSVISMAARSIGLSLAAEMYAEDFFANGAVASGAFRHPKTLSDRAYEHLQKQLAEEKSAFGKKFTPFILEEGMEWETYSIPAKDAQMLETRQLQVTDIARWFGLPPHKLADLTRATFSNIEHQSIEVVNDALMPWIHRLEDEANLKLLSGREHGIRTKLNVRGLMRGDDASRAVYYQIMRNIGVYSTNDIRRLEDMDPVGPEGDELLVQLNQTTLKKLVEGVPEKEPNQIPEPDGPDLEPVRQSYLMLFDDAFQRILRREAHRFDQSQHKFGENGEFAQWLSEFSEQQREYMRTVLEPLMSSLAGICLPSAALNGHLQAIVKTIIDAHLEKSTSAFSAMASGQLADFEIPFRARTEARDSIERFFALVIQEAAK